MIKLIQQDNKEISDGVMIMMEAAAYLAYHYWRLIKTIIADFV